MLVMKVMVLVTIAAEAEQRENTRVYPKEVEKVVQSVRLCYTVE